MLVLKNVTKKFGELIAVDDLSFEIKPGEIFGLLGANGAGKTTTFRMIIGLLNPTFGTILWNNEKIDYTKTDKIGFLTEERSLQQKLKVSEQIIHFGRLKSMSEAEVLNKLDYWLDRFNISDYKDKKIKELSKGNQQKIQFISAVINEPKLLILDEPFSGLDPLNVEKFIEVIREFQMKGTIIIFSSHRIDHVELFCEKLSILVKGKAVIEGNIKKIKDDFKRKTIKISGDIDDFELKNIDGVINVKKNINEYVVSIKSNDYTDKVFQYIKDKNNITKFLLEEPSLSEIFIEKVGEAYDG